MAKDPLVALQRNDLKESKRLMTEMSLEPWEIEIIIHSHDDPGELFDWMRENDKNGKTDQPNK